MVSSRLEEALKCVTILGCPTLHRDSGPGRGEEWDLLHPGVKPEKNLTPSVLNSWNDDWFSLIPQNSFFLIYYEFNSNKEPNGNTERFWDGTIIQVF